jgi:hypothetical protein
VGGDGGSNNAGGTGGKMSNGGAGGMGKPPAPLGMGGAGGDGGSGGMPITGFTPAVTGGWKLGPEVMGEVPPTGVSNEGKTCDALVAVVRDFKGVDDDGHPDFQAYEGDDPTKGLVAEMLGSDRKPVYASKCELGNVTGNCPWGPQTTSKKDFDQWYRFADGVNKSYLLYFQFMTDANGQATFSSDRFFPLDGAGWGNSGEDEDMMSRNFGFTTELHTKFKYGAARPSPSPATTISGCSSTTGWPWTWAACTPRPWARSTSTTRRRCWGSRRGRSTPWTCSTPNGTPTPRTSRSRPTSYSPTAGRSSSSARRVGRQVGGGNQGLPVLRMA